MIPLAKITTWWRFSGKCTKLARAMAGDRWNEHRHQIKHYIRLRTHAVLRGFVEQAQFSFFRSDLAEILQPKAGS
jgi:hypothetical protein